jgi:hypothetical protein
VFPGTAQINTGGGGKCAVIVESATANALPGTFAVMNGASGVVIVRYQV